MSKKLLAILLCACLSAVVFAGCSSSTNNNTASANDTNASSGDQVEFTLAMHVANVEEQEPAVYAVVQQFMAQNPDVKINLVGTETNEHYNKMKMDAQAGTLPDVFFNLVAPSKEMAGEGYLYNLDGFIADVGLASIMNDNMLDTMNVDGSIYGLPYQSLVTGFWYNQELFDQYGVKVPETYDDLLEAVAVFSENGITTLAMGAQNPYSVWGNMGLLARFGYFDRIDAILAGDDSYNNEDFRKYYEKLAELREAGAYPANVATSTYYDAKEMFVSGRAAMFDSGTWDSAYMEQNSEYANDIGFSWGVSFSDGVGDQNSSMIVAHAPLCISAKVADDPAKEAAVLSFFQFYYSDDGAAIMIDNLCTPPTNYGGAISDDFLAEHPVFSKVMEAINMPGRTYPVMQPDNVSTEAFGNALYDSIYGVINGVYTPDEAMDMVDREIALG